MTTQASTIGTRLPALGVRYEGWVIGQLGLILALVSSALVGPAWSGQLRTAGAAIGIALIAPGVGLTAAGIAWLRRQLTPFPHPVPDGELITDGPFGLVRHPMYGGGVVLAVGWALATARRSRSPWPARSSCSSTSSRAVRRRGSSSSSPGTGRTRGPRRG